MKKDDFSENEWSSVFAARVTTLARDRGVTRSEIARWCGVSRQQVSNYLSGNSKPTVECVIKIARMLEVPVEYLLNAAGGMNEPGDGQEPDGGRNLVKLEAEEQVLLEKFRKLPRKKQRALLSLIKAM